MKNPQRPEVQPDPIEVAHGSAAAIHLSELAGEYVIRLADDRQNRAKRMCALIAVSIIGRLLGTGEITYGDGADELYDSLREADLFVKMGLTTPEAGDLLDPETARAVLFETLYSEAYEDVGRRALQAAAMPASADGS